jgi:flagellar basal-body rod protein FlgC
MTARLLYVLALCFFFAPCAEAGGLNAAMRQSAAGLKAQSARMEVVAQNIANVESVSLVPGGEPYRRKTVYFSERYNPSVDAPETVASKISRDFRRPFKARYDPGHPGADADGYVLYPNVDSAVENADMREAERSFEANLSALQTARTMYGRTLDLLR